MNERDLQRLNDVLTVVGSLLTIALAARIMLGPDALTRVKMRAYLTTSHNAKRVADIATTVALKSDTAYHRARNVTV